MEKKKPKPEKADAIELGVKFWPEGDDLEKSCPTLWDLLIPRIRDGVMVRQPGRLTVGADGGHWRIQLHCPTEQVQTTIYVDHLSDLWEALEAVLGAHKAVWTSDYKRRRRERPVVEE